MNPSPGETLSIHPIKTFVQKRKLTIAKTLFLRYNVKQSCKCSMNREKSLS